MASALVWKNAISGLQECLYAFGPDRRRCHDEHRVLGSEFRK
jgi:hypothetical protein